MEAVVFIKRRSDENSGIFGRENKVMVIQKFYLPILNFIYKLVGRISDQTRHVLMMVCFALAIISTYVYQIDDFFGFAYSAMANTLIGILSFGGMMIFSINVKMQPVKLRGIILYPMMACGIITFIAGIDHYIGYSYMCLGLFMAFVMPAYIIIWANRKDFDTLFKSIAYISVVLFAIYFAANCIIAPSSNPMCIVNGRYFGMASDPNGMAKTAVEACVCAIYLLYTLKSKARYIMIPIISMSIGMTILTVSRANLLALLIVLCISLIMFFKSILTDKEKKAKGIIVLLCSILVIALLMPAFTKCLNIKPYSNSNTAVEYNSASTDIETRLEVNKTQEGKNDYYAFSSGRIGIWEYCLNNISIIGNDVENGVLLKKDVGVVDIRQEHVHNTILEYLHRAGIFAGLSFLIIEVLSAVWVLQNVFLRKKNTSSSLFATLAITAFGIASLFDIVVLPFAKITVLLFYISLALVAIKTDREKTSA